MPFSSKHNSFYPYLSDMLYSITKHIFCQSYCFIMSCRNSCSLSAPGYKTAFRYCYIIKYDHLFGNNNDKNINFFRYVSSRKDSAGLNILISPQNQFQLFRRHRFIKIETLNFIALILF